MSSVLKRPSSTNLLVSNAKKYKPAQEHEPVLPETVAPASPSDAGASVAAEESQASGATVPVKQEASSASIMVQQPIRHGRPSSGISQTTAKQYVKYVKTKKGQETLATMGPQQQKDFRTKWCLDRDAAQSSVTVTDAQSISSSDRMQRGWLTASQIGKEENLGTENPLLLDLLKGLARKPSSNDMKGSLRASRMKSMHRHEHLKTCPEFDEYHY
eukprot:6191985-Amphidinium_carterae.1